MTAGSNRVRTSSARQIRKSGTPVHSSPGLVGEAVRTLRTEIMSGRLRPGQKLVEAELGAELQISRASVREVLRALQGERLIELIPHKGPSVASLGAREVDDIEQVWMLLTADALTRFARHRNVADLGVLRRRLRHVKSSLANGRNLEAIDAINAFFWYIIQRCGNAVLLEVVVSLVSRLNFLRAQSLRDDRWRSVCANEIGAILDALDASNPAAAHAATAGHILSTCQAARDVAITSDRDEGGDRPSVPPRSLPRIPLDDYLDRGLAPNDAPAVHERRGRRPR